MIALRDISDVESCRDVVRLQEDVWGRDAETVPASLLRASVKRGGILIGAYDAARLVGFVWSMPAIRDGALTQWSHMLGVTSDARGQGVGRSLKFAQRDRAVASGIEIVEWTFDPLQAPNAHLNVAVLGAVSTEYLADAYGSLIGPLHRGTPTDRLIACWHLRAAHVERRLARAMRPASSPIVRSAEVGQSPVALRPDGSEPWPRPIDPALDLDARRVLVAIPARFTEMQQHAAETAMAWRLAAREVFTAYVLRGYRVVDFLGGERGGSYVLER